MKAIQIASIIMVALILSACSGIPSSQPSSLITLAPDQSMNDRVVHEKLMFFYFRWKGVPHLDGGTTIKGVDCSGLIMRSYQDVYGVTLPRSTHLQSQTGLYLTRDELDVGDLVFFKTGIKQLHVGVYMGQSKFMHASSSRGVMISKLDNPYWQEKYWHARRLVKY